MDFSNFFRNLDPRLAGFLRGLVLALASAVVLFTPEYLKAGNNVPQAFEMFVPFLMTLLRTVEGFIDAKKAVPVSGA